LVRRTNSCLMECQPVTRAASERKGASWARRTMSRSRVSRRPALDRKARFAHHVLTGGRRAERGTSYMVASATTVTATWSLKPLGAAVLMLSRDGIRSMAE
jgi:hypothetical protein